MRSIYLAAVSAIATLASAGSALAGVSELQVHTLASATVSLPAVRDDQTSHASAGLFSDSHDNDVSDLSFANGVALATFGALHAYADAFDFKSPGGVLELPDAQATAEARSSEFFDSTKFIGGMTYTQKVVVSGFTSPQPQFGPGPDAVLNYRLDDLTTGDTLFIGAWFLGRPNVFNVSFVAPTGHETQLNMDLSVFAYDGAQSMPSTVFSDFSHTVTNYIYAADGGAPDVIGASGHDYALPTGGVPEPG
ncbi:MAG TPA: hypothetical protein VHN39_14010, partial [Phenylobacterium sp.]|nr:hypothetical protein [Phenylobacterium sp.]